MTTKRPIIFNDEMARAVLDGRKRQTRRLIDPQPGFNFIDPRLAYGGASKIPKFPYEDRFFVDCIEFEVISKRMERLNDISQEDAVSEGVSRQMLSNFGYSCPESEESFNFTKAKKTFLLLWESIYGPGSWDANPWVWVIEFKQV